MQPQHSLQLSVFLIFNIQSLSNLRNSFQICVKFLKAAEEQDLVNEHNMWINLMTLWNFWRQNNKHKQILKCYTHFINISKNKDISNDLKTL